MMNTASVLLLLLVALVHAKEPAPVTARAVTNTSSSDHSHMVMLVRRDVLGGISDENAQTRRARSRPALDSTAPPADKRRGGPYPEGTDVDVELRVFKVVSADVGVGTLELAVWFRLRWFDERLSWEPSEYGNVTSAHFVAGVTAIMDKEIWTPDLSM
jgi:hypothetical protein